MSVTRSDLIEAVRLLLARSGFAVSERCDLRPVSFDLVARRDKDLFMVKVLANVDALSDDVAHEVKLLCKFLQARPLLIGLRAGTGPLERGVIYCRHDIPIMTPETLQEYLHDTAPMVFAAPGGFYVRLDAAALRAHREAAQISLGVMAQIAGVSRRAIQMYEEGMSASIDAAVRLEEFLQADLICPLDPFNSFDPTAFAPPASDEAAGNPTERLVMSLLQGMGYDVRSTRRSPFNALSTPSGSGPGNSILTGIGEDSPQLRRRARVVSSVSRVTQHPGFFIVEHTTRTTLEGTPVISRTELKDLSDPEKILDLIMQRQTRDSPLA